jgi:hypothetical protein
VEARRVGVSVTPMKQSQHLGNDLLGVRTRRTDFITFGGGRSGFPRAARRLVSEARRSELFQTSVSMTDKDLFRDHPDFTTRHASRLTTATRGFGYWLWKPYLLDSALRETSADYLLYLDAGCVLDLSSARARQRLDEYCDIADQSGIAVMQLHHLEQVWCKSDTMDRLGLDELGRSSGQIQGAIILIKRSPTTQDFVRTWLEISEEDDCRYLDDSPSTIPNHPYFKDHRHDQAILSCLCKVTGVVPIADETYFAPDWALGGADLPIGAARHHWGSRFRPVEPSSLSHRAEWCLDRAEQWWAAHTREG